MEVEEYLRIGKGDQGLREGLMGFETMFPYLEAIADSGGIEDPFDERVVEAYWVGNQLLKRVTARDFHEALLEKQGLRGKLNPKDWRVIEGLIPKGATLHHSFHVLNVWPMAHGDAGRVEKMDMCRVSWGEVVGLGSGELSVRGSKLRGVGNDLVLGESVVSKVKLGHSNFLLTGLKTGDWVSHHWGWVCERLSEEQVGSLDYYTRKHLGIVNENL
jgi:hypothetical protein